MKNDTFFDNVYELLKKEGIAPSGGTEALYIVYLDDEHELLDSVSEVAKDFGFKTYAVTSAELALKFIEAHQHEIAYILSDYKMDPVTGFDFRKEVLKICPEIPFTILSGNVTKELALLGIDLKISGFLDKPITNQRFAEVILKDGITRIQAIKEDRELLQSFIEEAVTNLEQAEDLALAFEQNPNDLEAVNRCFGLVHTLKGASGYFKPKTLHQFVHRFEDLLKSLQRGEKKLSPEVVSSILKSFDFVKILLDEFKSRNHKFYNLEEIFEVYFGSKVENQNSTTSRSSNSPPVPTQAIAKTSIEKEQAEELKVPVRLLDEFMQTSGEMTIIRNMINKCVRAIETQFPRNKEVLMLSELLEELHEINATVQTQITNLRKIPVHAIFKPIPRVVRDVTKALGKEAELVFVGDDLAVDTSIAKVLSNSIIHLVRNSLDHGLEPPEDRTRCGKNRKGQVTITSSQKNDLVQITIEDDGRGINENSIKKKLISNGTHSELQAERLSKKELYSMIFEAGFSTAEKVTDISGRGVGMSMVKDCVTSVGGVIDIESVSGKGSKFTLSLPVPKSVLIRDCLFVVSQGMQFGIPQDDVLRVIRATGKNDPSLFQAQGTLTIEYENHLVPVVDLSELLELGPPKQDHDLNLIIVSSGNRKLGLRVDGILDIEDTVIKPLQGATKKLDTYLGAAFLGDGTIGLILAVEGLLNRTRIKSSSEDSKKPAQVSSLNQTSSTELLLIKLGSPTIYAIPSSSIYRIEEVDQANIKRSGGFDVVAYRNKVLTLLNLSEILGPKTKQSFSQQRIQTIVIQSGERFLGLAVESIEDIARTEGELIAPIVHQFGLAGNYLIGERTVTLVNLEEILQVKAA